jgi:hypothetical protein
VCGDSLYTWIRANFIHVVAIPIVGTVRAPLLALLSPPRQTSSAGGQMLNEINRFRSLEPIPDVSPPVSDRFNPALWPIFRVSCSFPCTRYQFRKRPEAISINEIVQELAQASVRHVLAG